MGNRQNRQNVVSIGKPHPPTITEESNLPIKSQPCIRFDISDRSQHPQILSHLEHHGFVVIAAVADAAQIYAAKDQFWSFHQSVNPQISRQDNSTWVDENWLPSCFSGILNSHGFNHSEFCWNSRLLPKVKEAFSLIWSTDDLVVSFDAGNIFRPWKVNREWSTMGNWWHVDQNSLKGDHRVGRVSVQGLVTYYKADASVGGLCIIPESHLQHSEICNRSSSAKYMRDFVTIDSDDPVLVGKTGLLISAEAGDLVLWDSRLVHCNTPALNMPTTTTTTNSSAQKSEDMDIIRLVSYVCMVPRSTCTQEVLDSRKMALIHRIPTSHWPNIPIEAEVSRRPPLQPNRNIADCSAEMLHLVGYE